MPYKAKKPCRHPGCPELVKGTEMYCEKHKPLHARPASERGYDSRWQKASKAYLRENPLCAECLRHGKYTQATVVDHVVPHRGNQELFRDSANWQPLCKPCHDRKTGREDSRPVYKY